MEVIGILFVVERGGSITVMSATTMDEVNWPLLGSVESQAGGDPEAAFARVLADQIARWQRRPGDEPLARQQFLDGWYAGIAARSS